MDHKRSTDRQVTFKAPNKKGIEFEARIAKTDTWR
jgi:hypothetical protein